MRYGSSRLGLCPAEPAYRCGEAPPRRYEARRRPASSSPPWEASPGVYPTEKSLLRADALALGLREALDRIAVPLGRAAHGFVRDQGWGEFGFARLEDHARERFSRSGRWVRDLAALGDALMALPGLAAALSGADGRPPIGRVAALLLGRVATPSSLDAWVALARALTVRQLRDAVARARASGSEWPCAGGRESEGESEVTTATLEEDDASDCAFLRLPVPQPVLSAFDEAVDLHRAVQGTEATVTSFVEALVAETVADGEARDDGCVRPLHVGSAAHLVESALARSTENWRHLPRSAGPSWALARAGASLERLETIERSAGEGGPKALDAQIRDLISLENDLMVELGRVLAGMSEARAWPRLRFAGAGHYAEERLRLSRTTAEDRLRAARGLRRLPVLRRAYESGRVGLEAALTAARAIGYGPVPPEVERAWAAHAETATVKRLRDEALALRRSNPGSPAAPPDDREWHAALRRDPGTARRRILKWGLEAAGFGCDGAAGCPAAASDTAAHLDAALPREPDVFLRLRLPRDLADAFLAAIESARRRLTARAEEIPWDADWDSTGALPSLRAARMFSIRCRRLPAWVGLLALLEDYAMTWDPPQVRTQRRPGEEIYRRDGWRCAAPGCTSRRNLEEHHIEYRSCGGGDDPANRLCLCRFHHHRGEHGGLAACTGSAPLEVLWRLGRPAIATWFRNERRVSP